MPAFSFNPNDLHRLNRLMFVARGAVTDETAGGHRTRKKGEGTDFLDYRPYVPGDDFRKVDWTLYGRLRQLFVRLHEAPRQLSITLLLDASQSMGFGHGGVGQGGVKQPGAAQEGVTKLLQAQRIASALGFIALSGGDRLFASAYSDGPSAFIGPLGGRRGLPALVRFLQKIEPGGTSDLAGAVSQLHAHGQRRGLVIVVSDFLNNIDPEKALSAILGAGGTLLAIQVLDPLDRGVGLKGNVRLRDSETGRTVDVRIDAAALARYQATFERHRAQLESFCRRHRQHYLCADTSDNYLELVCEALRSRAVLR
jgi:uncharacterized protein (DUF58 family)